MLMDAKHLLLETFMKHHISTALQFYNLHEASHQHSTAVS
jgi:hypothetical protein